MLRIYDGNNQFRLRLERDPTGLPVRNLLREAMEATDPVVWVFDGVNANKRRRTLYPQYKMQREAPAENIFASMRMFEELLQFTPAIKIKVPEWEADDVIATLALKYANRTKVHIYSNDADLLQLHHANITQEREPFKYCEPRHITLYKTTVGDPQDNIKGIPGFGQKAFEACNKDAFVEFFAKRRGTVSIDQLGVKPKIAKWIQENEEELRAIWDVVCLMIVPQDQIEKHTVVGSPNQAAIDAALKGKFV